MSRVALVCSEPLRTRMAGIGIRYLELARRLPAFGVEVVVLSAGPLEELPDLGGASARLFERGNLRAQLADCNAVLAQGQLANDVVLECPHLPTAIDLYDPWLVENLHYANTLGLEVWRNDHATWNLQLSRGDLFLCSSEDQRLFYLGFLAALGRVNPESTAGDADLRKLARVVPFGLPDQLPPYRPVLTPRRPGSVRLLFGGLYDWYDPHLLLDALEQVDRNWSLVLVRNPNPDSTPQRLLGEVLERARRRGWLDAHLEVVDWVPADRRFDLLRDCDLLVAPHRPSLETRLSLRTRFLEAWAVSLPVVVSDGGAIARLVREADAGWVCPPGNANALRAAIEQALDDPEERARRGGAALALAEQFHWDVVLEGVVDFLQQPWRDPSKERFASPRATHAPPERWRDRLARRFRRLVGSRL